MGISSKREVRSHPSTIPLFNKLGSWHSCADSILMSPCPHLAFAHSYAELQPECGKVDVERKVKAYQWRQSLCALKHRCATGCVKAVIECLRVTWEPCAIVGLYTRSEALIFTNELLMAKAKSMIGY